MPLCDFWYNASYTHVLLDVRQGYFPHVIVKRIPKLSISVTLVTEMVLNCKNIEKLYMCNMDTLGSITIGLIIKVSSVA